MATSFLTPEFKYLTEEFTNEWKSSSSPSKFPSSPVPLHRFLYELCWAVVKGDLPQQKCMPVLEKITFAEENGREEMASVLADTIAHMGQDLTMPGEYRARLIRMAKWLVDSSLVPPRFFQERCEEEFLWDAEMIKIKAQDLKTKEVRVNTRLLYQQTKFNLLREESEGYAKLMTLLCQGGVESSPECSLMPRISRIKSLIGHFDLDPNRVFDIVMECFELYPDYHMFYKLIPIFPKSHAAQILGFKFQFYQRIEVKTPVPSSLYQLAALLVKAEFIDLDGIYAHLLPRDEGALEHYEEFVTKRFDEVNKIGKINLAATGKDLMDDDKQDLIVDLFTAFDMESEAVVERAPEVENNQCLGLLMGFLVVDDWHHAHILFDRLSFLNPAEHIQISEGVFRMIEKNIHSAYGVVRHGNLPRTDGNELPDASSYQNNGILLPKELFQMLSAVGPYLYRDVILLQKVCRLLRAYYQSALKVSSNVTEARLRVEEALGTCLLPSLQLIPANPAVGQEIWELLSLLPYEGRCRLYGEWEKDDEKVPAVLAARQIAKLDTRRILKRLAKENLKPLGRMVAKLAHANPMTVLRTIVVQIEAYKDMIVPVVDAFKYLTQLEYDALEYVVIERLAQGGREKLKDDGLNLSDWLQSLASFWGHLCKKYPSMELRCLFQYLVNQLKRGSGVELVLLQELIQQMANIHYTENVTEEQLDAMAGSETLRYQATLFGAARNNKALSKSMNRLRDALLPKEDPKLAIPLLLLIAQHRSMVIIKADVPYIKTVSEQFDRCHGTLLQYVEFLSSALTPAATYAQLVPQLDDLIHKYHLEPEVAFLIYRPVMRLFKRSSKSEAFWPLDIMESDSMGAEKDTDVSSSPDALVLDLGFDQKSVVWADLLNTVSSMLPRKTWNSLSPDLYATFWGLTLYDLHVPRNRYELEIAKQNAAIKALEEISDNSSIAITKRKKEKERIQEVLDRLICELQKHEEHVASVRRHLGHQKDKWLSSCPDISRINIEFLQRCIFPRCIFSMPDAVYCSMFAHTLHSLGTPNFNMVNHVDVIICKILHPMICCCTEFEAGRLGRFLFETLKMAYHWKSDESIFERECGSMPGFALYIRNPNSPRLTFTQFVRAHWKWVRKITALLTQCLESNEYMEIRNALILLTKISGIFPVTRKSGLNLERRVVKIKGDEREDLKVLATGVAAALAARKSAWISEEEFVMGLFDIKPAASPKKIMLSTQRNISNGPVSEATGTKHQIIGNQVADQPARAKPADGRADRAESSTPSGHETVKGAPLSNGTENQPLVSSSSLPSGTSRPPHKATDDPVKTSQDEAAAKGTSKTSVESETRTQMKRPAQTVGKQGIAKDENKSGKSISRNTSQMSTSTARDVLAHPSEGKGGNATASNGNLQATSGKVPSSKMDGSDDSTMKVQKRPNVGEDQDRVSKRKKSDIDGKDGQNLEVKSSDKERPHDMRLSDKLQPADYDRGGVEEQNRSVDKLGDRPKDKPSDKYDKDHKEKVDRHDKSRSDDYMSERQRDRSMERHGRERSVEKTSERGQDRSTDKSRDDRSKDDRVKPRHSEPSLHSDERFSGQHLPPPPPLPPSFVPQSLGGNRRDEDADRRVGSNRHIQRLSPRHDEKEHHRSEESVLPSHEDTKRRKEDDLHDKKRDERGMISLKVDERDREKMNTSKDDLETASKRRKIKRDLNSSEPGEYSPGVPPPPASRMNSQSFEARERGDSKGLAAHRGSYVEEQMPRIHGKETVSKLPRRDIDQHDRDWDEEKRHRTEAKRKHRK